MDTPAKKLAEREFNKFLKVMTAAKMQYDLEDGKNAAVFGINIDNMPTVFRISCDEERNMMTLCATLPFTILPHFTAAAAVAVAELNYKLADGHYNFDTDDGRLYFYITLCYADCLITEEVYERFIALPLQVIHESGKSLAKITSGKYN